MQEERVTRMLPKPKLKPFDLEEGDKVRYVIGDDSKTGNIRIGMFEDPTYNIWVVKILSKNVFVCENKHGVRTAFRKADYQIGKVVRVD